MSYALGLTSLSQCKDCTAGFVCPESGTVNATEPCAPGFWCPGGDASSNRSCTLGHYCAGGDRAPEPCAAGSFQNTTGAASCHACTPGSYCEQAAIYPRDCPEGFYCPKETTYATEFACPNGTYSNRTMLRSVDGCDNQITPMPRHDRRLSNPSKLKSGSPGWWSSSSKGRVVA